jgi:RNA polymerase sigma-70 factor (ECF subfamily)
MTGDIAEAEDLTQDAFIQVFRKIEAFRGDSAFSTWLYRVAVNTVLMKLRKRKTREVSMDEPICLESSSVPREYGGHDPHLQGTIDRIALIRAISELPRGYREIFILHEVAGYGHQEIARLLQCSIGNTKSQLHKARLKIRDFLLAEKKEVHTAQQMARRSKASQLRFVGAMTAAVRSPQPASERA